MTRTDPSDLRHMTHALGLARRGLGRTAPNPAVGCVIVAAGRVIGRGWTQPGGRPHAETMALAQAGDAARGATAYVSLEPCAHHGKTPPCADALAAAGIARLVAPMEDPDPRVSGRGFTRLQEAGVVVDLLEEAAGQAAEVNAGFLSRQASGRPHLTLKLATSLDGRIATARGESRWITGPAARRRVHLMRAQADAVLLGAGTARADDPMLDIRDMGLTGAAPIRVIADSSLALSLTSRLARTAVEQPVWFLHHPEVDRDRARAWSDAGAALVPVQRTETGVLDPVAMLAALGERGLNTVLCEGGGQLAAALLRAGLVDRLVQFSAGLTLGATGIPGIADLGIEHLADAARLSLTQVERVGGDVMAIWERPQL